METEYHKSLKYLLKEYGEGLTGVLSVSCSGNPLLIDHGWSKGKQIVYKPDVQYVLKKRRDIICFEVLESQIAAKTISDIVRCIFHDKVIDLYLLVKKKGKRDSVLEISEVIISRFEKELNLYEKERKKRKIPINVTVEIISEAELENKKKLFKRFKNLIKI